MGLKQKEIRASSGQMNTRKFGQETLKTHTMVPEKTLESPLDCKDIKPVNPKGNQP